jgi:hypothetical protein
MTMPRTIQEILDHADKIAQQFEDYQPDDGDERPVEEYLLGTSPQAARHQRPDQAPLAIDLPSS